MESARKTFIHIHVAVNRITVIDRQLPSQLQKLPFSAGFVHLCD